MAYRKKFEWPPHVREMMGEDLRVSYEAACVAKTAFKIRIYIAVEQGVTTREIAEKLGLSQAAVSRYRIDGEAAFAARQAAGE